ncbi:ShlB/FhaC/HecB family hemolysin secretion/activation protein [Gluconacetobacter tumulicola]|uniref:ShlB/FhaC/HecB family hemolysin secretion/activation protein n=1 Tax=Gluconacetobacter tumulicola TaxID=1017177 RepID=A0A7W4JH73_9PROT|nr:ShlB/FhaC/HecB family hemolysin secretion/activation protein [Gluconacetobacter tumulicola]MBB2181173.1 ShlB/FhaC/HecB family hemolysin secretion/activation protein [Gluconacetobacter tumulicola]
MRPSIFSGCALAVSVLLAPALAHAQAYNRLAPKQLPLAPTSIVPAPSGTQAPPLPPSGTVVIPVLKGLVFLPDIRALNPSGPPAGTTGIVHTGLPLLGREDFTRKLAAYLGKPLKISDLDAIAQETNAFYKKNGHPFVYVIVPPQNISSGTVQIVVTEYRLGALKVTGNRWFSSALLRQNSGLVPGRPLNLADVQVAQDRLNDNPFRTVDSLFSPGTAQGTTDVTLQTSDRLPLHVYASYDNAGVPMMGRSEWAVGGTWGNVAGLGQILSYQFTHSVSDLYSGHAISWSTPLPWHDRLQVFGSYAWEHPDYRSNGISFNEAGHSGQASLRYIHDLPALAVWPHTRLTQNIQVGYDFKTTNNTLEFGGAQIFASEAEVNQFPVVYNATMSDPYGQTTFQNQLVFSPGGLTGADRKSNARTLVPGASNRYVYDTMTLTRTTWLPGGATWILQATGQVASANLMYSNQLGLGGLYMARGYATDTALGTEGASVTNEVRAPAFSLTHIVAPNAQLYDTQQVGVFYDYGHVSQVHPIAQSINESDLSSIGLDLHSGVGRYASMTFNVGWRLHGLPPSRALNGFGNKGAFGNIAINVGY